MESADDGASKKGDEGDGFEPGALRRYVARHASRATNAAAVGRVVKRTPQGDMLVIDSSRVRMRLGQVRGQSAEAMLAGAELHLYTGAVCRLRSLSEREPRGRE